MSKDGVWRHMYLEDSGHTVSNGYELILANSTKRLGKTKVFCAPDDERVGHLLGGHRIEVEHEVESAGTGGDCGLRVFELERHGHRDWYCAARPFLPATTPIPPNHSV